MNAFGNAPVYICQYIPSSTEADKPKVFSSSESEYAPTRKAFPSAAAAVHYLIKAFQPQIIGFGEFHNEYDLEFKSTSQRFAEEIIPFLKRKGYRDLVLEFIPDDPATNAELKYYKRTGKLSKKHTPTLLGWTGEFDAKGIKRIYDKARGMNLYGANLSLAQQRDYQAGALAEESAVIIRKKVMKQAEALLQNHKRVLIYSGTYHNDVNPDPKDKDINFGSYFNQRYRYLEVDLIVPEIFSAYKGKMKERSLYRKYVPKKGVQLVRVSKRKFVILFPYSI